MLREKEIQFYVENWKMFLPCRNYQLHNYGKRRSCPGSSSPERDLIKSETGVSCTTALRGNWHEEAELGACITPEVTPPMHTMLLPAPTFSILISKAAHCTWQNMGRIGQNPGNKKAGSCFRVSYSGPTDRFCVTAAQTLTTLTNLRATPVELLGGYHIEQGHHSRLR